eukprot:SAG31_NODE_770_length_12217_cov_2.855174_15_plen_73_part_01
MLSHGLVHACGAVNGAEICSNAGAENPFGNVQTSFGWTAAMVCKGMRHTHVWRYIRTELGCAYRLTRAKEHIP